jgi:hypothetical protein
MKRIIIISILAFVISYAHTQVRISIIAAKKCSCFVSQITGDTASPEYNELIIDNKFESNKCKVIIIRSKFSGSLTFNFSFGNEGKMNLQTGLNPFIFNSKGTIVNYPDDKQFLHSPFQIYIYDEKNTLLYDSIITYIDTGNNVTKTKTKDSPQLTKIPYYDALSLADYNDLEPIQFMEILNYYRFKQDTIIGDYKKLLDEFKDNDFLYNELKTAIDYYEKKAHPVAASKLDLSGLSIPSLGGLDVTNIADGFARFIVKRAKTELSVSFFDKFKTEISKPQYKDMQSLFPQTFRALTVIGDEIYNYEAYIQTLRECFEKDLANQLTNMQKVIENHEEFFRLLPELKAILISAFYIGQQLQDKQNPGDIIVNYPDNIWEDCNPNYRAAFQTLKMVSASLRNKDAAKGYWISSEEMKMLANNETAFRIYIGLLIQLAKKDNIRFKINNEDKYLWKMINAAHPAVQNDLPAYTGYFREFIQKTDVLGKKIKGLKKTDNDSLLLENYYGFFSSVIDFLKFTTAIENLPHIHNLGLNLNEKSDQYLDAAQTAADIVIDVNRRNYGSAIVNVVHLYSAIFLKKNIEKYETVLEETTEKYETELDSLNKFKSLLTKENDSVKKDTLNKRIQIIEKQQEQYFKIKSEYIRLEKINAVLNSIYKYGTFMATIVQAKSSADVAKAIEAAALPTGSARIKRESIFNVSLNSYIGPFFGYEQIRGFDTSGFKVNAFGITAPVGIAISLGKQKAAVIPSFKSFKGHWSWSLFVSVVDLGAIAAFRIKDDSTSQVPTIQLQDIISPGLFLSFGIPKCPISVNLGVQMGPNLRAVSYNGNSYSNSIYLRYSMSVVVDIPIFNFYSKGK